MKLPPPRRCPVRERRGFLPRSEPHCGATPHPVTRRVSVVIPAWNAAATLGQCITSCLRQTVPPSEIVVVDDGSTDATVEIAERFLNTGIPLVIARTPNHGASAARNKGVNLAWGEFIIFADADDVAPPDRVETTLAEFAASDAEVVYGQKEYFDRDCQQRRAAPLATPPTPRTIIGATGYGTQALACKRSVFTDTGVWFDESMVVAEDAEHLVACLSRDVRVHCAEQVVCWQRRTAGSLRDRGDWSLMRQWITVKHRAWLGQYMGREVRISEQVEADVLEARRQAGYDTLKEECWVLL